jgi:hypothetical protein
VTLDLDRPQVLDCLLELVHLTLEHVVLVPTPVEVLGEARELERKVRG